MPPRPRCDDPLLRDEYDGFVGRRKFGVIPFSRNIFAFSFDFFNTGIMSIVSSSGNKRLEEKFH
jgi:hypothetical protein